MTRLDRLTERLNLKEFQLRALLDVTKAINNNVERGELLALYERIMRDDLGITRLLLFERSEGWQKVLGYGAPEGQVEPVPDPSWDESGNQDIHVINPGPVEGLGAFDVAVPVHHLGRALAYLLIGDIDESVQRMSPAVKHLNFIQTLTNLIAVALENRRLAQQALQRERYRREMELAAEMQSMLVPQHLPRSDRFEAAAWYQPHSEVSGDYYDMIPTGDGRWMIAMADVSGKGMAASLLMSNFQATLRALVQHSREDMDQLVHELNAKVSASARGERFISLFLGELDLEQRRIRYANMGHNAPLLHHAGSIRTLQEGGIALGMMPTLPFLTTAETVLEQDSTLLCYTDGLVEQEDAHGDPFEVPRLERALRDFAPAGCDALNEAIIAAFEAHRGGQPYLDDIALLTCRLR